MSFYLDLYKYLYFPVVLFFLVFTLTNGKNVQGNSSGNCRTTGFVPYPDLPLVRVYSQTNHSPWSFNIVSPTFDRVNYLSYIFTNYRYELKMNVPFIIGSVPQ